MIDGTNCLQDISQLLLVSKSSPSSSERVGVRLIIYMETCRSYKGVKGDSEKEHLYIYELTGFFTEKFMELVQFGLLLWAMVQYT